jgi:hypothetical protein
MDKRCEQLGKLGPWKFLVCWETQKLSKEIEVLIHLAQ